MPKKFNLSWNNTSIQGNANVVSQEAGYQSKLVPGWITTGFTNYANPIPVAQHTSTSPDLNDNIIYQFRVNSLCSTGGPMPNIGGVVEAIHFACIVASTVMSGISATCTINLANTSITKVRFSLKEMLGSTPSPSDPVKLSPTVVARDTTANTATVTVNNLEYTKKYYWETELYSTIRNNSVDTEVISSSPAYLGVRCIDQFTMPAPPSCAAVTALIVEVVP